MRANWLIWLPVMWGAQARAEGDTAPSAPLSDEDLLKAANAETIKIYDERPDKPFDRDTEVRLTGEQLAARGVTDLASALALLPDVTVRDAGRGGLNIDIRGARKGSVAIVIDGVVVSDPYYGTFDVTTIPVTDIVEIRMATTALSPIDGPGGPGGVIEVHTRDGIGEQIVIARATTDSLPSMGVTGTARVALSREVGLRLSASGIAGGHDMPLPMNAALDENRHAATGAARIEVRHGAARLAIDAFVDDRHYIAPPSDTTTAAILMIDREQTERVTAKGDYQRGKLQLQGQLWGNWMHRRSRNFNDATLQTQTSLEDLSASRAGGMALATRPIMKEWRLAASYTLDREVADVHTFTAADVHGDVVLNELAGDVQYEHGTVRLDGSAGVAIPLGIDAAAWPEGKLIAKWRPGYGSLDLTGTLARKGRVPSLRERFDPTMNGNQSLGPEKSDLVEVRAIETRGPLRLELAPFYRHQTGTIRVDPVTKLNTNLGTIHFVGADVIARGRVHPRVELGGAYSYVYASSATAGPDPLDRLPHHRGEGWIQILAAPQLSLLARMRYFGAFVDQGVHLPAYTLVEATATAPLSKQYLAVLRVDDLLDRRPLTRNDYHTLGRVISLVIQGQWE